MRRRAPKRRWEEASWIDQCGVVRSFTIPGSKFSTRNEGATADRRLSVAGFVDLDEDRRWRTACGFPDSRPEEDCRKKELFWKRGRRSRRVQCRCIGG